MYKIGMIGERDSVIGYMALGFAVHEAEDADRARALLHKLAKDSEYAIIFIVENFAIALEEDIAKYKDAPTPAIICIPGKHGTTGYGLSQVKKAVERAVGADILFKE